MSCVVMEGRGPWVECGLKAVSLPGRLSPESGPRGLSSTKLVNSERAAEGVLRPAPILGAGAGAGGAATGHAGRRQQAAVVRDGPASGERRKQI